MAFTIRTEVDEEDRGLKESRHAAWWKKVKEVTLPGRLGTTPESERMRHRYAVRGNIHATIPNDRKSKTS